MLVKVNRTESLFGASLLFWTVLDRLRMDLNRIPNDQKLQLCRTYFRVGFLLLPVVWAVNAVWFFREAFIKPPYDEQKQIRKYVVLSLALAVVAGAAPLAAWVAVYQLRAAQWGELGDSLSYIVPLGRA